MSSDLVERISCNSGLDGIDDSEDITKETVMAYDDRKQMSGPSAELNVRRIKM